MKEVFFSSCICRVHNLSRNATAGKVISNTTDPVLLLEPSAEYLSSMSNIPQISASAINSIWTLASSPLLRDMVLKLLHEIDVLPVTASSWQQKSFSDSPVLTNIGDHLNADTLSNLICGKCIVFTGSLMHSSDGKASPISRALLVEAVKRLGMLQCSFFV